MTKTPLQIFLATAERMANNHKLQGSFVNWACDMYDRLADKERIVRVEDLLVLQSLSIDYEDGLEKLDCLLARRGI
ncbi:MAG: hypothetical protein GX945_05905 [Lentisphaerae bacterium]|nr:hypothetical protein [Lentisphaerota bacterium]